MENLKIEELKKELFTGDFGDCFYDYDNGCIGDIVTEIADNHVDIYNYDLLEWAKENYLYIDEAMQEFGKPDDFLQYIRQGQYYCYEKDLYENLEDSLKHFMYTYIENVLDIHELTEEQNNNLLDYDFSDTNDTLDNLIYHIRETLSEED